MSDADADAVTVSDDDVTVRKSLNDEDFQTLAIVFDIRSERDEAVRVLLSDRIPDDVPIDDIGFHPDYGAEHWTVDGEMVAFEREIDAGEEYTTIFGVREYDEEAADRFLSEPELEVVTATEDIPEPADALDEAVEGEAEEPGEPDAAADTDEEPEPSDPLAESEPLDLDADASAEAEPEAGEEDAEPLGVGEIASEEASQEVRDVISGDRDTLSGLEGETEGEEETAPAEEEPAEEPTPGGEPAEGDEEPAEEKPAAPEGPGRAEAADGAEAASGGDAVEEAAETAGVTSTGGVGRVLAKELRQGQVSEADREVIRDELVGPDGSTEARIQHLQNEVSDLAAYTDALEEFLDEHGPARELLDEVQAETAELQRTAERIEERTEATSADVERVEATVADVEASVAELEASIDDLTERLEAVDELDERLADVEDRLDDLEGDLDERVAGVEDDLEAARDDIDEMAEFRERLTSVFGPAGGSEGEDEGENESEE